MYKYLTKRNVLIIATLLSVVDILLLYPWQLGICARESYSCANNVQGMSAIFDIFIPVLIFSFLTYKMSDEVFRAWLRYALWWVPLTMLCVFFASSDQSQSLPAPSTKALLDIGMVLIFVIVSIVIIVSKRTAVKRLK
jgi:hypothetical protein